MPYLFHLTNSESCTVWLPIEFHGFTSRFNSKGYHLLVTWGVNNTIDLPVKTSIATNHTLSTK